MTMILKTIKKLDFIYKKNYQEYLEKIFKEIKKI